MPTAEPTPDLVPIARELEACYTLDASGPGEWPDVDVTLLTDSAPVAMEAALRTLSEVPSSVREVSRKVKWTASAGTIREGAALSDGEANAVWTPPEDSQIAEVLAEAEIYFETTGNSPQRLVLRKKVPFSFLAPASSLRMVNGIIDGYDVGQYLDPNHPPPDADSEMVKRNIARYQVPSVFYKIEATSKSLRVSPHLTLGHFVIDYPWGSLGMPQYIALDINLIRKLEDLISLMNGDGHHITGLTAIYGFRCPSFNQSTIDKFPDSNLKARFSMHQYGRALDFIIDENKDLVMDDLNGDGRFDVYDAGVVMHYVNLLDRKYREEHRWELVGGAGLYERHDFVGRVQTPYIHVDTRGFLSASGELIRWKEPAPPNWPDGTPIRWSKI